MLFPVKTFKIEPKTRRELALFQERTGKNGRKIRFESLADLYDELTMPPELRTAHQQNDRAVMQAYGFPIKGFTESDCVAELMKLYQKLTEKA